MENIIATTLANAVTEEILSRYMKFEGSQMKGIFFRENMLLSFKSLGMDRKGVSLTICEELLLNTILETILQKE
jgi:hypothetical protein